MALVREFWAGFTVGDSAQKTGSISFRVPEADYDAYVTAATPVAAQLTPLGLLFANYEGLMSATIRERRCAVVDVTDPYTFPATDADVYRSDKIKISMLAGADIYTMSIPCRNPAAYTTSNGIDIITSASGTTEVQDFVTAFNGHVVAKNGNLGTVNKMTVNDV